MSDGDRIIGENARTSISADAPSGGAPQEPPPSLENAITWLVAYVRHNFRPRFDIEQRDEDELYQTMTECYIDDVVRAAALRASAPGEPTEEYCICNGLLTDPECPEHGPDRPRGDGAPPAEPSDEAPQASKVRKWRPLTPRDLEKMERRLLNLYWLFGKQFNDMRQLLAEVARPAPEGPSQP